VNVTKKTVPHFWFVWKRLLASKDESLERLLLDWDKGYSFSSFAILDAMFLKPMEVPEIRLKRTPLSDSLGSLQTSISHCTRESVLGSPCTHRSRNRSRCS